MFELEGRCTLTTQRTGRHLVIKEGWERDMIVFNGINFSGLRSLTVFGEWKSFLVCAAMKVPRMLDLENASGVTDKDLEHILKLVHSLKFLSLRGCTEICHLPTSLGDLRQLQTLDVRGTSIVIFPKFFTKLKKLQYIRAGTRPFSITPSTRCAQLYCFPWPRRYGSVGIEVTRGIEKLTALHTLGVVNVGLSGGKAILKELKKLTQLHKLGVTGVNKNNSKEFCSAISDHGHLESLSVCLSMGNDGDWLGNLFSFPKKPLENLRSLKIHGLVKEVPAWIRDFPELTKLELETTMSEEGEVIQVLGDIKELRILRLCVKPLQDGNGKRLNFCVWVNGLEDHSYLNLKILEIACNS
jgi:Leucine-rich repeat (LRR) protein